MLKVIGGALENNIFVAKIHKIMIPAFLRIVKSRDSLKSSNNVPHIKFQKILDGNDFDLRVAQLVIILEHISTGGLLKLGCDLF